jgi:sulfur carrier protein
MQVLVNNQKFELVEPHTVANTVTLFGANGPFAVALNGQFVAKGLYSSTKISVNDKIDILSPIQGG